MQNGSLPLFSDLTQIKLTQVKVFFFLTHLKVKHWQQLLVHIFAIGNVSPAVLVLLWTIQKTAVCLIYSFLHYVITLQSCPLWVLKIKCKE